MRTLVRFGLCVLCVSLSVLPSALAAVPRLVDKVVRDE